MAGSAGGYARAGSAALRFRAGGAATFPAATSVELGGEIVAGLRRLAVRRRTTLSTVILALFELFLFHWTRQDDLCVGMSVANRNHPDVENLIGFFVNVLPIRCRLSADMDFDDLLTLMIDRSREALEYQTIRSTHPDDRAAQPARRANRQPLVNVIYGFQNFADVHVAVARDEMLHRGRRSGRCGRVARVRVLLRRRRNST